MRSRLGPLTEELFIDRDQRTERRDPFEGWLE